jgi:hypothetical protein
MRACAAAFPGHEVVQQLVAQLPWGHVIKPIEALKDFEQRLCYKPVHFNACVGSLGVSNRAVHGVSTDGGQAEHPGLWR